MVELAQTKMCYQVCSVESRKNGCVAATALTFLLQKQ